MDKEVYVRDEVDACKYCGKHVMNPIGICINCRRKNCVDCGGKFQMKFDGQKLCPSCTKRRTRHTASVYHPGEGAHSTVLKKVKK
jgi:hypothetical protein